MVGKKLRKLRTQKGLSQQQLAKIAGVPQSTIWYIERENRNPTIKTMKRLATALGVSIEEFLDSETKEMITNGSQKND
ncbi:DNA-binding XRE family transcriptional regulator [Caldicellulosiruptor bescii]|uniref:Transcriptional regulator, XRE family n=2 Tax=Caldicellulosiruptor bescii TaxID=31899 RepID=B9MNH1_CALBD|nr:helix-turn-helix transcriptional regulator [Caldicellulosiruptor bescii]ACM61502.1 transcriptional regulator, XRE family [Caldicellulosiruptor bescii DSM 6725]PBC88687.1 DNA-binding XRE family transcriptional regulator [Caldicellulosiruptor bescii]PBC91832.1 DNA-binding XRE family transcriptional regulator [Caldicellulosiruptor bescii]PBD02757.1 DNA-binding XRE family transcriptional regulator [Caldicellulosiruptor bescii]PBD07627.1 DNA-binding XRE family transcriptional regulator [Caldicel